MSHRILRLQALLLLASLSLLVPELRAQPAQSSRPIEASPSTGAALDAMSSALESLAADASSAVVRVFTVGYAPLGPGRRSQTAGDLLAKQRGSGSGVILDASGLVVTNAHVVAGARRIQVLLAQAPAGTPASKSIVRPRGELIGAQLVGIDRETDLAVLRIDAGNVPFLALGDSDEVRQGQMVLALGSPFGLENSVSLGVVSAVARQLEPEDPAIYIQTDAPINPGNSGGPLLNSHGQVIGINSAIASRSGGSEGVGFALPSNIVRNVFDQIRTGGRVRRGEIGVNAQTITPEIAAGLKLTQPYGVILADVMPGGPAAAAGLRQGDVVMSLDGKPMENGRQLEVNLYRRKAGEMVNLEVRRGAERRSFQVAVVDRKEDVDRFADRVTPEKNLVAPLGILALDIDDEVARLIPGIRQKSGAVVAGIAADTPFWEGGFEPGDVIHAVNGTSVSGAGDLRSALDRLRPGDPVVIHIERRGQYQYLSLIRE